MSRYLFIENKSTCLRLDRALLMRHPRMQTCTWPRSAALASKKQLRILSKAIRRMYICLSRTTWTHLRLDKAPLMRHKDANLHLTKKCGACFHKAAQYQPDVTIFVQLMRHKDANLHLKQLSISRICLSKPVYMFKARQGSADAPQGCKPELGQEVRHWLPKSNQPCHYIFVFYRET